MKKHLKLFTLIVIFCLFTLYFHASYLSGNNFYFNPSQFVDISRPPLWIHGYSLILLSCNDIECANKARDYVIDMGGSIAILVPPHAMVGWIPPEIADELIGNYGIESIYFHPVDLINIKYKNDESIALVNFFNYVTSGELEYEFYTIRKKGLPLINDALIPQPINFENYFKNLFQKGIDIRTEMLRIKKEGILSPGNSDSMVGTVACCLMFVESDGSIDSNTYTWIDSAVSHTYYQCTSGLSWWANKARRKGVNLSFTLYYYPPDSEVMNQGYEPIFHSSKEDYLWINSIMSNIGFTYGSKFDRVEAFNTWLRNWAKTDWAYSAFIAYNPPDQGAPEEFTDGYFAYAYLGGPYTQLLYKNDGWSLYHIGSTLTHESGHIFWACDEYYQEGYGGCTSCDPCNTFRPVENGNCEHPSCNPYNSVPCIMRDSEDALCTYTENQVGWFSGYEDQPPSVTITFPQNGAIISKTVKIKANASDDKGVTKVEFYLDNVLKGTDTSAPYEWNWDTTKYSSGTHVLKARAYDTINQTAEHSIQVTVDQPPKISITSPLSGANVHGIVAIKTSVSDDFGIKKVQFYVNEGLSKTTQASPHIFNWGTNKIYNGTYTIKTVVYDIRNQTAQDQINLIRIPHAPVGLSGRKENNSSVLLEQYINVLTWQSNDLNTGISKYRIYQKEGENWALLAEVKADTFEYWHLYVGKDEKYSYVIKAVDEGDREGESADLEVQ